MSKELCSQCAASKICKDADLIAKEMAKRAQGLEYVVIAVSSLNPICPPDIKNNNIRLLNMLKQP